MSPFVYLIPIAFLAGSIPFGFLIGKAHGIDIRKHGSGNIGATNVGRILGPKAWLACFVLDFLKGFIPTLVGGIIAGLAGSFSPPAGPAWLWLATMAAAVLGHMFPPWLGFKGGKGVATSFGAALGIVPLLALPGILAFLVFIVALVYWRYVSLGAILAALSLPLFVAWLALAAGRLRLIPIPRTSAEALTSALPFLTVALALAVLVVFRHRANLKRIRAGTEPKIGQRRRPPPQ